jgi:ribosomal protein S18 acetylase RimI-like enzyme
MKGAGMKFRKLTIKDYPAMMCLWKGAGLPVKPKGRDSRAHLAREISNNPDFFIGAFEGKRMCGAVFASHDGRKGWINHIAVDPDYRRHGLAEKLTAQAEKVLKKQGIKIIALLIYKHNLPSLGLAKKMGYVEHSDIAYLTKRKGDHI